jgi:hypothetical protein
MALTRREFLGLSALGAVEILTGCGAQTENTEVDIPKRNGPPFEGSVIAEGQATSSTFYKSIDGTVAELPNVPIQITAGKRQATIYAVHRGDLYTQNIPKPGTIEWDDYMYQLQLYGGEIIGDPSNLQNCNGFTLEKLGLPIGKVWVEHSPHTENFFNDPKFFTKLPNLTDARSIDQDLAKFAQPNDVLVLFGKNGEVLHTGLVHSVQSDNNVQIIHKPGEGHIIQTPARYAHDSFSNLISTFAVRRPIPNP